MIFNNMFLQYKKDKEFQNKLNDLIDMAKESTPICLSTLLNTIVPYREDLRTNGLNATYLFGDETGSLVPYIVISVRFEDEKFYEFYVAKYNSITIQKANLEDNVQIIKIVKIRSMFKKKEKVLYKDKKKIK